MKRYFIFLGIAALSFCQLDFAVAQITGSRNRRQYDGALEYQFDLMQAAPTIPSGAPPDVLAGYLYLQYLASHYNTYSIDSAFADLTYSDTLKQIVKYVYELDDYDPVLFHRFLYSRMHGSFLSMPAHLSEVALRPQVEKLYADTQRTAMLGWSDIIAHIRVTGTRKKIDTLSHSHYHAMLVQAQILGVIKGQTVPSCLEPSIYSNEKQKVPLDEDSGYVVTGYSSAVPADSGACLQFEYYPEWHRGLKWNSDIINNNYGQMQNSDGSDWIKPDSEYVVFLRFIDNGYDSVHDYNSLWCAYGYYGKSDGLYPIVGGSVQDPYNDFGFGANLPTSDFIDSLRNRIYNIVHP